MHTAARAIGATLALASMAAGISLPATPAEPASYTAAALITVPAAPGSAGLLPVGRGARALKDDPEHWTWKDGVVPYKYDVAGSLWGAQTSTVKAYVQQAMDEFTAKTHITFRPAKDSDTFVLTFTNADPASCHSGTSPQWYACGDVHTLTSVINIGLDNDWCWNKYHSYLHEIGHSLGLSHTFQRFDRGTYVRAKAGTPAAAGWQGSENYGIEQASQLTSQGLAYDFRSVMHYDLNTALGLVPTAAGMARLAQQGTTAAEVGNIDELSQGDVASLAKMYGPGAASTGAGASKPFECKDVKGDTGFFTNPMTCAAIGAASFDYCGKYSQIRKLCPEACGACSDTDFMCSDLPGGTGTVNSGTGQPITCADMAAGKYCSLTCGNDNVWRMCASSCNACPAATTQAAPATTTKATTTPKVTNTGWWWWWWW